MADSIVPFEFEGNQVRFVGTADYPEWVAQDVCSVLELSNIGQALSRLDEDEKRDGIIISDSIGRTQSVWAVNESGFYSLVLRSRKPQAKRFKKWLTSEVLPAIRKTGRYEVPQPVEQQAPLMKEFNELAQRMGRIPTAGEMAAYVEFCKMREQNPNALAPKHYSDGCIYFDIESTYIDGYSDESLLEELVAMSYRHENLTAEIVFKDCYAVKRHNVSLDRVREIFQKIASEGIGTLYNADGEICWKWR